MRPQFVKGVQNVFLYRLFQFLGMQRRRLDIPRWIAKYSLMRKRLLDAWMDLFTKLVMEDPMMAHHFVDLQEHIRANPTDYATAFADMSDEQKLEAVNDRAKERHMQKFPFSDNLFTLIFMVASQLQESQRTLLTSHLTMRGHKMENYTWEVVRTLYMELLSAPKSSLEDPSIRDRTSFHGSRSFCVIEGPGECLGATGY